MGRVVTVVVAFGLTFRVNLTTQAVRTSLLLVPEELKIWTEVTSTSMVRWRVTRGVFGLKQSAFYVVLLYFH